MGVVQFFGRRLSSQEVAGYNEPRDGCHTHKFLPVVVKLDLIICSSVGKIKIWHDNDQFQVRFLLLSSIPQSEDSTFPSEPETERWEQKIHPTNRSDWYDVLARPLQY